MLGAFSYALDLTEGQPAGHCVRSCYIGCRIGHRLGLSRRDLHDLYYAILLKDLGCSSNAARICELYDADDRAFKQGYKTVGTSLASTLKFVFTNTARRSTFGRKVTAIGNILANGDEIAQELMLARCTRGADIAAKLRFSAPTCDAIYSLDEHWDGSGRPGHLRGDAIPLFARIALLAQIADVFHHQFGRAAATEEVARRSGNWLDPQLCAIFATIADEDSFWNDLQSPYIDTVVAALAPPEEATKVDDDYLDAIAAAFGEVIDAKSPYTSGHSARVRDYASQLGFTLGLTEDRRRWLRRGALLHDVGKLGVSNQILDKPAKLEESEWAAMRGHADGTREILGRIGVFSDLANAAAAHHERLDGRGYPLGLKAPQISIETRIITVCDFYDALTANRPYRDAMPVVRAIDIIGGEVGKAVDPDCFEALRAMTAALRA